MVKSAQSRLCAIEMDLDPTLLVAAALCVLGLFAWLFTPVIIRCVRGRVITAEHVSPFSLHTDQAQVEESAVQQASAAAARLLGLCCLYAAVTMLFPPEAWRTECTAGGGDLVTDKNATSQGARGSTTAGSSALADLADSIAGVQCFEPPHWHPAIIAVGEFGAPVCGASVLRE